MAKRDIWAEMEQEDKEALAKVRARVAASMLKEEDEDPYRNKQGRIQADKAYIQGRGRIRFSCHCYHFFSRPKDKWIFELMIRYLYNTHTDHRNKCHWTIMSSLTSDMKDEANRQMKKSVENEVGELTQEDLKKFKDTADKSLRWMVRLRAGQYELDKFDLSSTRVYSIFSRVILMTMPIFIHVKQVPVKFGYNVMKMIRLSCHGKRLAKHLCKRDGDVDTGFTF